MPDFLNNYLFHWSPSKAILIGGYTLSWDARCTGIYIGFAISVLHHYFTAREARQLPPLPILFLYTLMFLPLFIDIVTIRKGFRVPSNNIRYITGLLFGCSLGAYLYPCFVILTSTGKCPIGGGGYFYRYLSLYCSIGTAFLLKEWDNIIAYSILESMAVFGMLGLFVICAYGTWNIFGRTLLKKRCMLQTKVGDKTV